MKILMLGNGFDLYHKLPTTYSCFLKTASLIHNSSKLPESIGEVFDSLKSECPNINISYSSYKGFYDSYLFDSAETEKLLELKTVIKDNMWFKFFCNFGPNDVGWIDFEKDISFVLSLFSTILKDTSLYLQSSPTFTFASEVLPLRTFDAFFTKLINRDLLCFNEDYVFQVTTMQNKFSVNDKKIYAVLYDQLKELSKALRIYLRVFIENPISKMNEQEIIQKNELFRSYDHVITFNYTSTYELLYGKATMYHIHGKLDNRIILGINPTKEDELSELDTSYIMFKKYYQRVYHRTDNEFIKMLNRIRKSKQVGPSLPNDLVVCGHSLDSTDQDIIKEVFNISKNIYIVCHDLDVIGKYITNLINIYGKRQFDEIRSQKELRFITYEEWENIVMASDIASLKPI